MPPLLASPTSLAHSSQTLTSVSWDLLPSKLFAHKSLCQTLLWGKLKLIQFKSKFPGTSTGPNIARTEWNGIVDWPCPLRYQLRHSIPSSPVTRPHKLQGWPSFLSSASLRPRSSLPYFYTIPCGSGSILYQAIKIFHIDIPTPLPQGFTQEAEHGCSLSALIHMGELWLPPGCPTSNQNGSPSPWDHPSPCFLFPSGSLPPQCWQKPCLLKHSSLPLAMSPGYFVYARGPLHPLGIISGWSPGFWQVGVGGTIMVKMKGLKIETGGCIFKTSSFNICETLQITHSTMQSCMESQYVLPK